MSTSPRFEVRFEPAAYREYQKLDGSLVEIVDKKLEELEYRADVIGKLLRNTQNAKLAGCREIKLRDAGIRIIYQITDQKVNILRIVYILTIEKRADDYVFNLADKRLASIKDLSPEAKTKLFKAASTYQKKDKK